MKRCNAPPRLAVSVLLAATVSVGHNAAAQPPRTRLGAGTSGNDYGWSYSRYRRSGSATRAQAAGSTQPSVATRPAPIRRQPYGSNFGWGYSTPQTTYYNGPAFGLFGPFSYGPGGRLGGGSNVQYFQRGRNAFWVETYRDDNGRLRVQSGQFFGGP